MLLKCIRSFYSGSCSYSVGKVFFKFAKSPELFADSVTKCHPLLRSLSSKLSVQEVREEKGGKKLERKSKDEDKDKESRKKKSRKTVSQEFEEYFMQKPSLGEVKSLIPEKYLRRRRKTDDSLYLIDQDVAAQIVEYIKKDVVKDGCFVLEGSPGLGLVSERLIKAGVKQLHLFETCSSFLVRLKNLQKMYPDNIFITNYDIFSLWKLAFQDRMDNGGRVKNLLSPFPAQDWIEEPSLKIVGAVRSSFFLKHIVLTIIFQTSLMELSRPEFYLVLPPSLHQVLTCSGEDGYMNYRALTVLFQLFYDYEVLEELPREAFVPWSIKPSYKRLKGDTKVILKDEEVLYLIKMVPKKDLHEKVASPDKLPLLWFFVRHNMQKRTNQVIPKMESWIPNCGARLVLDGYNIFTEFGDLSPQQILNLFHQFIEWPEFPDCSFTSSLEMALMRLEDSSDWRVDKSEVIEEK